MTLHGAAAVNKGHNPYLAMEYDSPFLAIGGVAHTHIKPYTECDLGAEVNLHDASLPAQRPSTNSSSRPIFDDRFLSTMKAERSGIADDVHTL